MSVQTHIPREELRKRVLKALRAREEKTLANLAAELDVPLKALPHVIRELVNAGEAVKKDGRTPTYLKAPRKK